MASLEDVLLTFDPTQYMYINPELETYSNVFGVEDAYMHYITYGFNRNLKHNYKNTLPVDFNERIYSLYTSNSLYNGSYLDQGIVHTLTNDDLRRLTIIHYNRIGSNDPYVQSNQAWHVNTFYSEPLYRIMNDVTREGTRENIYYEYASRWLNNEVVIGRLEDFRIAIENYRDSSLHVRCNLVVDGNFTINSLSGVCSNIDLTGDMYIHGTIYAPVIDTSNLILHADYFYVKHIETSNTTVNGDLTVLGEMTTINTHVQISEDVQINNSGASVALYVNQQSTTDLVARFTNQGSNAMVVSAAGFVGVSHSNPVMPLDVNGSSLVRNTMYTPRLTMYNTSNGYTSTSNAFNMQVTSSNMTFLAPSLQNNFVFQTTYNNQSQNVLNIYGDGRVGVGVNNPQYALHVNGNIGTNTHMYISGNIYCSGLIYGLMPTIETGGVLVVNNDAYLNRDAFVMRDLFVNGNIVNNNDIFAYGNMQLSSNLIVSGLIRTHSNLLVQEHIKTNSFIGVGIGNGLPLGPVHIGTTGGLKMVLESSNNSIGTRMSVTNIGSVVEWYTGDSSYTCGGFRVYTSTANEYKRKFEVLPSGNFNYNDVQCYSNVIINGATSIDGVLTANSNVIINSNLQVAQTITCGNMVGTLQTSNQPQVTSVGTLVGLNVDGTCASSNSIVNNILEVHGHTVMYNPATIYLDDTDQTGLTVNGVVSANQFYTSSDMRIKSDIAPLTSAAAREIITRLSAKEYILKTSMRKQYGLIGQEVEALYPAMVDKCEKAVPIKQYAKYEGDSRFYIPDHGLRENQKVIPKDASSLYTVARVLNKDYVQFSDVITHDFIITAHLLPDFTNIDYIQLISVLLKCVQDLTKRLDAAGL